MPLRKKIKIYIALVIVCSIFFGSYLYLEYQKELLEKRKRAWTLLRDSLRSEIISFDGQPSVVIKDLKTGWELYYEKNKLYPAASLAKIPIMGAVFKAAEEGAVRLGDAVELKGSYKVNGSGYLKDMPNGMYFSLGKLIEIMIAESDNTAANILINMLGFDYINQFFKEAGMVNSSLNRKMMDFKSRSRGIENYTTSQDMAIILERIYRGQLLNKKVSLQCLGVLKLQRINDRIPGKLPDEAVVAHKTGLENNVCHDVGIVFTPKGDYLICVLTGYPRSNKAAKRFIADVSYDVYNYLQSF
jgi:beta-lactamase class A